MYPAAHVPSFFMLALMMEDSSEDRRQRQVREQMQRYRRRLSAQQRDERWQYKSERRTLARQHQRDSFRSLTQHERDRRRTAQHHSQHDIVVCMTLHHNLSRQPATFHMLCMRHVLCMRILLFSWGINSCYFCG